MTDSITFQVGQRVEQRARVTKDHLRSGVVTKTGTVIGTKTTSILVRDDENGREFHWNSNAVWEIIPLGKLLLVAFSGVCGECLGVCPDQDYLCEECRA